LRNIPYHRENYRHSGKAATKGQVNSARRTDVTNPKA